MKRLLLVLLLAPPAATAALLDRLDAFAGDVVERVPAGRAALTVASVTDGDTLRLSNGARVRLVQIDAPETHSEAECYGKQATRALARLTPVGSTVRLVRDPLLDDRDRYDRLLRYVVRGGKNVNVALVRQGAAAPYFYRGERGRYAGALLKAVREARRAKRGMWGACAVRWQPDEAVETFPRR